MRKKRGKNKIVVKKIRARILAWLLITILFLTETAMPVSAMPSDVPASYAKAKVKSVTITNPSVSTLVLKKGKTYTLKVKVDADKKANKKITYSTSDNRIATVNKKGKIKALKNGKATITVKSNADKKKKDSIKVIVGTPVSKLTLDKTAATLYEGESMTLKATVTPKKASMKKVSFQSSDTSVATVTDSGKVTCKKDGTATITATAQDGSKKKAVCRMTVKKKETPDKDIDDKDKDSDKNKHSDKDNDNNKDDNKDNNKDKDDNEDNDNNKDVDDNKDKDNTDNEPEESEPRQEPTKPQLSAELLALEERAQARKQELLQLPDSLEYSTEWEPGKTYTGTAYYLSNRGDDANDGLTLETPKASLHAFDDIIQEGDALLLECGSTWYIDWTEPDKDNWDITRDRFVIKNGTTISSYGVGERPVIRGDLHQEDVMQLENWTLSYADSSDPAGKKIWHYKKQISDPNVIVFDDGEGQARQVLQLIDLNGNALAEDGSPLSIENALTENLTFLHVPSKEYMKDGAQKIEGSYGDLYLRCDAGNPASVYHEIAIPHTELGLYIDRFGVIENMDLRYFTGTAIELDDYGKTTHNIKDAKIVENCLIGWCGGYKIYTRNTYPASLEVPAFDYYETSTAGGGIQTSGDYIYVRDNYLHDCGPMTLILSTHWYPTETGLETNFSHIYEVNNFFERCGAALHWAAIAEVDGGISGISDLVFSGNMVMHTGEGWVQQLVDATSSGFYGFGSAVEDLFGPAVDERIEVKDNLFYCARQALFTLNSFNSKYGKVENLADFSGNTYVQFSDAPFLAANKDTGTEDDQSYYLYGKEQLKEALGDTEGIFLEYPVYSELDRAHRNDLMEYEIWKRPDNAPITGTEYRKQLIRLIKRYAPDRLSYFEENVKQCESLDEPCIVVKALLMNYYAAVSLGIANYNSFLAPYDSDPLGSVYLEDAFPNCWKKKEVKTRLAVWEHDFTAASVWNKYYVSPVTGRNPLLPENGRLEYESPFTVAQACEALTRLYEGMTKVR